MLKQFKSDKQGSQGEYITENYNSSGYQVVVIAPTFAGKTEPNWGRGDGKWTVDYQDTSTVFWKLMQEYKPIAVMTTSRNVDKHDWVFEIGAKNLKRDDWVLLSFNGTRKPFIGAGAGDPASAAGLPNAGLTPKAGDPPDATRNADPKTDDNAGRAISANAAAIQALVKTKLEAEFAAADLKPVFDTQFQGVPSDNYVSGFTGYHAVWYNAWKSDSCKAGWHTHVDYGITVANASKAIKLQLEELIKWLDAQ